jgi:rubrerythrin
MIYMNEEEEIEQAVEAVDKMEDEEAEARDAARKSHAAKEEDIVIICPKCKLLVSEADFRDDEFSEITESSIESKINCPNCGYIGLPVEVSRSEYQAGKKAE